MNDVAKPFYEYLVFCCSVPGIDCGHRKEFPMSKTVTITISLCLFLLTLGQAIEAQDKAIGTRVSSAEESSNREQDGLKGPVRRVRLERAQIFVKEGEWVEGRRELQWVATYDLQGRKIDSVAYPLEGSSLTGKEQYQYDENGNIIEMVARGDDGSVLSKETYRYEFDELGNWKKMTSSIAVYENGKVSYEPIEVSYRTIAYYYGQAIDKLASGVRADSSPTSNHTAKPSTPTKVSTEVSGAAESVRPANAIGSFVSGNQAKTGTVEESSVATVGDGSAVTRAATITPAVGNTASAGNEKASVKQGAEQEPRNATLNLPKATAKITSAVSSTESSDENRKIKNTGRDETSSNLISSTRTAPSPTNNTSDSSGPSTSLYQEGLTYLAAGAYKEAVEAFNQSIRLNPNDAIVYMKLGLAYSALRKYKEAVNGLKMAIRINPEIVNAEAYYYLGYSYFERGNHKDALEAFKQALYLTRAEVIDKDAAAEQSFPLEQIHYSLGRSYLSLGRYQEAINELNEAVKVNPKLAKAYFQLGIAYLRFRDRSSAQRQQRTLISLDPALAKQLADALSNRNIQDFPCAGSIYFCR
jgi:tetratricopeptide (TPR) repeat protein